ncbi:uncharacterized protein N7459_001967 [Penicillium hispanicum]|uniref:uncharacterized protein n=1 Tax=Penicillium hispanicum TaxID=1080232 RepID=UPI00253F6859|nr:uncharacterized protein N7459_001967 [Penicillium hispanicum]KAJ5591598.1 hypothetical protein N7459_001967 [Penicillium hispanicum]
MAAAFLFLLGLAPMVIANPVYLQSVQPVATPTPTVPDIKRLNVRDGGVIMTTIPVSKCYNYVDQTRNTKGCDRTAVTSAVEASPNPYPFTTTLTNDAVVAYATSWQPYPSVFIGTGDSSTIHAGSSVSLQMNPTKSVNVGYMTESSQVSSLYTAISNSISAACPKPTSGATVTTCSTVSAVTGIAYVNEYNDLHTNGELEISIPLISVSDATVLDVLINTIANGITGIARQQSSTSEVRYCPPDEWDSMSVYWPTVNLSNAPGILEAIFSKETAATDGKVLVQDLEVSLALGEGGNAFDCSDVGLVLSGLSALGSLIPGFGFLGMGAVGSELRFGMSVDCKFGG